MSTVRDMIRRKDREHDIYSVTPDATVFEALKLMARQNIGAVMVMTGDKVEGILSERDCVRKLDLEARSAQVALVHEIMTSRVIYVEASQPLEECMALMIEKNIRHLPVYDNGQLLGLISVRDVLKEIVDVQQFMLSHLERYITGGGR